MKTLVAAAVTGAVLLKTSAAWACGRCFGDGGGGSIAGWIALAVGGMIVYALLRRHG